MKYTITLSEKHQEMLMAICNEKGFKKSASISLAIEYYYKQLIKQKGKNNGGTRTND